MPPRPTQAWIYKEGRDHFQLLPDSDRYLEISLMLGSLAGRLEIVAAAREVLHEVPASDPSAHITSCALYQDSTRWLQQTTKTNTEVFCAVCNASGLLQVVR